MQSSAKSKMREEVREQGCRAVLRVRREKR